MILFLALTGLVSPVFAQTTPPAPQGQTTSLSDQQVATLLIQLKEEDRRLSARIYALQMGGKATDSTVTETIKALQETQAKNAAAIKALQDALAGKASQEEMEQVEAYLAKNSEYLKEVEDRLTALEDGQDDLQQAQETFNAERTEYLSEGSLVVGGGPGMLISAPIPGEEKTSPIHFRSEFFLRYSWDVSETLAASLEFGGLFARHGIGTRAIPGIVLGPVGLGVGAQYFCDQLFNATPGCAAEHVGGVLQLSIGKNFGGFGIEGVGGLERNWLNTPTQKGGETNGFVGLRFFVGGGSQTVTLP